MGCRRRGGEGDSSSRIVGVDANLTDGERVVALGVERADGDDGVRGEDRGDGRLKLRLSVSVAF
jgi:hypothetical protein